MTLIPFLVWVLLLVASQKVTYLFLQRFELPGDMAWAISLPLSVLICLVVWLSLRWVFGVLEDVR